MAQFDIYHLDGHALVVDLQTDSLTVPGTRLVAPLRRADQFAFLSGLTPRATVGDTDYLVRIPEMAAIQTARLGEPAGSLADLREELEDAIALLITGV